MNHYTALCVGFLASLGILALLWGLITLVRWLL